MHEKKKKMFVILILCFFCLYIYIYTPCDRNGGSDWRESARNARQEEQEKAIADKRKKLLRAIPTNIPGVSAVVRGDARSDIREIEALLDMQVQQYCCFDVNICRNMYRLLVFFTEWNETGACGRG